MGLSSRAPGAHIGSIMFVAGAANPLTVVGKVFGGLTVERAALGNYSVAIPITQEIDTTNRIVHVSRRGAVAAFATELDAGSDSEVNVIAQDLAGALADTGDTISVSIWRTAVGEE